jgi:hypothetical protein
MVKIVPVHLMFGIDRSFRGKGACEVPIMGGKGSGNFYQWQRHPKKTTVEACRSINVNYWMRESIIRAGLNSDGALEWRYQDESSFVLYFEVDTREGVVPHLLLSSVLRHPGKPDVRVEKYTVRLSTTVPRFGGVRWWFHCPIIDSGRYCGRRVGKLYMPFGGRYFGCRHCYDLTYRSRQEGVRIRNFYKWMADCSGEDFATVKEAWEGVGK